MKQNVLVIGASGVVGSAVVTELKKAGHVVRVTTSKKDNKQENVYLVNVQTGEGLKEAFSGIDRAFLMSPGGYADQFKILSPLIQEAKKHKLNKVVLMSTMGADADPTSPLRRSEVELEKSGLSYNIIRPNWFMQNFNTFWLQGILEQNKILLPAGTAKTSFIDVRDIAAVAAKLLLDEEKNNQAFNLTGSEALDHSQVASSITEVTGRKISYQEISAEDFKKSLLAVGAPADYVDFLVLIMGYLKAGYSSSVTTAVSDILGRNPINFQTYARDMKNSWIK